MVLPEGKRCFSAQDSTETIKTKQSVRSMVTPAYMFLGKLVRSQDFVLGGWKHPIRNELLDFHYPRWLSDSVFVKGFYLEIILLLFVHAGEVVLIGAVHQDTVIEFIGNNACVD